MTSYNKCDEVKIKPRKETFSDLCLEAEDGDEETDCYCDAQTQNHRLGVVKTAKNKNKNKNKT